MYLIQTNQPKPNRIETPEGEKGDKYHLDYGRWVIGNAANQKHENFVRKYNINKEFYKNNQWIMPEDVEAFFMDESGQDRHRIRVTKNYIQPMVEQYRGNASRMRFDMKIFNLSPTARSRKDKSLSRLKNYELGSAVNPGFRDYLNQNNIPVGATPQDTEAKFENSYTDRFVVIGNRLIKKVADLNRLENHKVQLATDLACGGVAVMKPMPYGGDWVFKRVSPDQWGFDHTAKDDTLRDSEFFWEFDHMSPTTIYEQYPFQIGPDVKSKIEAYVASAMATNMATFQPYDTHYKVPVYTAVWRDVIVDMFGYVVDQWGQRVLARINYIEEGAEEPTYTMKDVLPVDQLTPHQKKVLRGKNTAYLYVDNWRYVTFIPYEAVSVRYEDGRGYKDVVLDRGILPYQEPDLYRPTNMQPPYKVGMWSYIDGEIMSPVDVAINPQRMINRFMSIMENRLNTATGSGTVYDRDFLREEDEDEFIAKINRGEAVGIRGRGKGVQNVVGKYEGLPYNTLVALNNLVETMKLGMEDSTGVNEGLKGTTNNPDQLVGVMQLMIQRGTIIQEPFYKALTDVYEGCYQSILTAGRRYYIDNDLDLEEYFGEEGASILRMSREDRLESLRVTLQRAIDPATEKMYVESTVLKWLQFGLIDHPTAASLIGRATFEEAVMALRDYQKDLLARQRMAAQQQEVASAMQQNAQQQAGRVLYGEQLRQEAREDTQAEADRQVKRDVAATKQPVV